MARTRTIRPQFFTSVPVASVSRDARLLFIGTWIEADDEGRLIDSTKRLAGALYPHDEQVTSDDVEAWLGELQAADLLVRYEVDGRRYIQVKGFAEHQKPPKPTPSKIPAAPSKTTRRPRLSSGSHRKPVEDRELPVETCGDDATVHRFPRGSVCCSGLDVQPPMSPVEPEGGDTVGGRVDVVDELLARFARQELRDEEMRGTQVHSRPGWLKSKIATLRESLEPDLRKVHQQGMTVDDLHRAHRDWVEAEKRARQQAVRDANHAKAE